MLQLLIIATNLLRILLLCLDEIVNRWGLTPFMLVAVSSWCWEHFDLNIIAVGFQGSMEPSAKERAPRISAKSILPTALRVGCQDPWHLVL